LYQAPKDLPIVFPTQVSRFVAELNKAPSKLNDGHKKLAQTLFALHQHKNPYSLLPEYEYKQLQKGIYCKLCKSFSIKVKLYCLRGLWGPRKNSRSGFSECTRIKTTIPRP